jgi:NAD(P)-dependent dehydrogenase (short-subunit alcohol dehydrogenase family)/acyl dehydratase
MLQARVYAADELKIGLTAEFERQIVEEDVLTFAGNSGDHNPLHVDSDYARKSNYQGRIVHGAFQVGLASALLGTYLPGRNVLLGSVNARFLSPLYFPCRVLVRGEITAWNPQNHGGNLKVIVLEASARMPTAEIAMGFTLRGERRAAASSPAATRARVIPSDRMAVLVTGAAGGIGGALVAALASEYLVLGMTHRQPLDERLKALEGVCELSADIAAPGWEEQVEAALDNQPLFGIVHAAWPGLPHGGLLRTPDEVVERQITFGAMHTVRLARLLFAHVGPEGGRFVAISSTAGGQKPILNLAAYSLGKATLEHTVRLLAPELARKNVTINTVCPSFLPVGLNRQADERLLKIEAARVPLGRLCATDDVVGMVRYLLSRDAAFVSGQSIGLAGGQL